MTFAITASRANCARAMAGHMLRGSAPQWPASISRSCACCHAASGSMSRPSSRRCAVEKTASGPSRTTRAACPRDRLPACSSRPSRARSRAPPGSSATSIRCVDRRPVRSDIRRLSAARAGPGPDRPADRCRTAPSRLRAASPAGTPAAGHRFASRGGQRCHAPHRVARSCRCTGGSATPPDRCAMSCSRHRSPPPRRRAAAGDATTPRPIWRQVIARHVSADSRAALATIGRRA